MKSGNRNLLEHSGPVQVCTGTAVHIALTPTLILTNKGKVNGT